MRAFQFFSSEYPKHVKELTLNFLKALQKHRGKIRKKLKSPRGDYTFT